MANVPDRPLTSTLYVPATFWEVLKITIWLPPPATVLSSVATVIPPILRVSSRVPAPSPSLVTITLMVMLSPVSASEGDMDKALIVKAAGVPRVVKVPSSDKDSLPVKSLEMVR